MSIARVRTLTGLAAAAVPCAILVHLVAEAISLGHGALCCAFVIRHLYLGLTLLATATWFARTVGIGLGTVERRRRCALIGAELRGASMATNFTTLAAVNLAFFGLTQVLEGVPIASGDWFLGFAAAIAGSLVSALFVYLCGRSIICAVLVAIGLVVRAQATNSNRAPRLHCVAARCAAIVYSLFAPNRPPPTPFLV